MSGHLFLALVVSASSIAQLDELSPDWLMANAPNGFDMTPDGTAWINIEPVGQADDFAIRAIDVRKAQNTTDRQRTFWVRGYHKRNTKLPYRETKVKYVIDCRDEQIQMQAAINYRANGEVFSQNGATAVAPIIPGSRGAIFQKLVCSGG